MANVKELLDFISRQESRGNYNAIWGGIKKEQRPKLLLTQMTVSEVLAWQDSIDHLYQSEAAGRYQVLEDTLRGVYKEAGLRLDSPYDTIGQDAIGTALLKRRGLTSYIVGAISAKKFANNLAREWASLPVVTGPKRGRSYYAGDGLNKSHVTVEAFMLAVESVKNTQEEPKKQTPDLRPVREGFFVRVLKALLRWLGDDK